MKNKIIKKAKGISVGLVFLLSLISAIAMPAISGDFEPQAKEGICNMVVSKQYIEIGDTFNVTLYINTSADSTTGFTMRQFLFNETSVGLVNMTPNPSGKNVSFGATWIDPVFNDDGSLDNSTGNLTYVMSNKLGGVTGNNSAVIMNFTALGCGQVNFTIPWTIWSGQAGLVVDLMDFTNWTNTTALILPQDPASIGVTAINTTKINITFTPGVGDDNVTLCGKAGTYPSSPTDSLLYNGTSSPFEHEGLDPCTTYYYRAWGWNETIGEHSYTYRQGFVKTDCLTNFSFAGAVPANDTRTANCTYNIQVNVTVNNDQGAGVGNYNWWINTTLTGYDWSGTGRPFNSSTPTQTMSGCAHNTTYWWNVTVTDGAGDKAYANYTFTTGWGGGTNPGYPSNPVPISGATSIGTHLTSMSANITDADGDPLNVTFYWKNGTEIGNISNVDTPGTATISPSLDLLPETIYQWYVVANDICGNSRRGPKTGYWSFTTVGVSIDVTKEWIVYENNSIHAWINLTNNGAQNMTDVLVTEDYPTYLDFNGSNPAADDANNNTWTVPYLNMTGYANNTFNISIWLILNTSEDIANGTYFVNNITVNTTTYITWEESSNITLGLCFIKEANKSYINDSVSNISFWINVTNCGDFNLTGINITETYWTNLTFNDSWPDPDDKNNNTWNITHLAPGETFSIRINLSVGNFDNGTKIYNNATWITDQGTNGSVNMTYIQYGAATERLRINYNTGYFDTAEVGDRVISILGVVLILAAIFLILVIMRSYGYFSGE